MTLFFTIATIIVLVFQAAHLYYYGAGNLKVAYPLAMVVFIGFMLVETALAINDPSQWAIILFNITNLWGLLNAVRGYTRERKTKGTTT